MRAGAETPRRERAGSRRNGWGLARSEREAWGSRAMEEIEAVNLYFFP